MNKKFTLFTLLLLLFSVVVAPVILTGGNAYATSLEDAIAATPQGTEAGQIDPNAKPGFLGIPGAPQPNMIVGFLWAIWVGWIFSTVGAFGGIMAGVGHITVFGLADYGKGFKKTSPVLNKLITDSIRVSNQWLVGLSGAVSSFNYYKMGRLVLPLGIMLAIGSISGSFLIPVITAGKISLKAYLGYFGLVVFIIGGFLFYETTPKGQAGKKEAKAAAKAFEESNIKGAAKSSDKEQGVKVLSWGMSKITFSFYGVEFSFKPIVPIIRRFFHRRSGLVPGHRRRVPVRTVPDQHRRAADVPRGRYLSAHRSRWHDHQHHYLHGRQGRRGLLASYRCRTNRHFCGIHDRPQNVQVHPRHLAETPLRGPGHLRGPALHHQGLFGIQHRSAVLIGSTRVT